jgi:hypothetical protein
MSSNIIPVDPVEIPPTEGGTLDGVFVSHLRFQDLGMIEIDDGAGGKIEIPNMPCKVTCKYMASSTGNKVHAAEAYKLSGNLAEVAQHVPSVQHAFDVFTEALTVAIPDWKAWEDAKSATPE